MKVEDIRAARLAGLRLRASTATDPTALVHDLVAMQAQLHPYARWSIAQRTAPLAGASIVDAAFDRGEFLRTHVLRPTWHIVGARDLRWLMRLSGPRVHAWSARRYAELGLDQPTLDLSLEIIARAVAGTALTRRELAAVLEDAGVSADGQRIAYLVMHAEVRAVVCSGPIRGKQHTYASFDDRVSPDAGPDGDDALAHLAARYFASRGPATPKDFAWWAGLKMGEARAALAGAVELGGLVSLEVDGRTYWCRENVLDLAAARDGVVDLVQCYDELIISYSESRDVLRGDVDFAVPRRDDGFEHVVLIGGRLLGHWRPSTHEPSGVEIRLARRVSRREADGVEEAIERYRQFGSA